MTVRERREQETLAQSTHARARVRPAVQPVPHPVEVVAFVLVQARQSEAWQQFVEDFPMQDVQLHVGAVPLAHRRHRRLVAGAPGIGESRAIDLEAPGCAERLAFTDHRSAPVDHGAEHVEAQCLDRVHGFEAVRHGSVSLSPAGRDATTPASSLLAPSAPLSRADRRSLAASASA